VISRLSEAVLALLPQKTGASACVIVATAKCAASSMSGAALA
jgi:hypothetical protein